MTDLKIPASSTDKILGWVLTAIGILGILRAIQIGYSLQADRPGYTAGLMFGGILINSLIPLIFISSGYYYLSGGNAKRIAKRKGTNAPGAPVQPISPVSPPASGTSTYPSAPPTVTPENSQSPTDNPRQ